MGKRKRAVERDGSPGSRLRGNIVDLYATGTISADRCSSLLGDAAASRSQVAISLMPQAEPEICNQDWERPAGGHPYSQCQRH